MFVLIKIISFKCILDVSYENMIFAKIESFVELDKVHFYSIRFEDEDLSETDKFIQRFENNETHFDDLFLIIDWITKMGEKRGAKKFFFRHEKSADALPPPIKYLSVEEHNLRLYCIRLSDDVVILLNGGIKSSQTAQGSTDLKQHFDFANKISEIITTKIIENDIQIKYKLIEGDLEIEV